MTQALASPGTEAILISLEDFQLSGGYLGDLAALVAALLSSINILAVKDVSLPWGSW